MRYIVFDLDETLGHFVELGMFWDILNLYLLQKNEQAPSQIDFNQIMDLYPEFIRPYMIDILIYLKSQKETGGCHQIMIYTNNQGSSEWAKNITSYFESKINYKLFDRIIAAFKINKKRIEMCRTSHSKSHKDLIKCANIPVNSDICFLDDTYFPNMNKKNIFYINVKPYIYELTFDEMIERFIHSGICQENIVNNNIFRDFMKKNMNMYNFDVIEKKEDDYALDKILSKKIIHHIKYFFNKTDKDTKCKNDNKHDKKKHTKKYMNYKLNKTMKNNKKYTCNNYSNR